MFAKGFNKAFSSIFTKIFEIVSTPTPPIPSYNPFDTLPTAAFDAQETASLTFSGSDAVGWTDLSGNGFNVIPDNTPPVYDATGLNGYPCLQISGGATSQRLISTKVDSENNPIYPLAANQAYTKSIVLSLQDTGAISNTLTVGQSALLSQSVVGNPTGFNQGTFFAASSEAVALNQVHVLTLRYGAGTGTNDLYIDDRLVATEAATAHGYTSGVLELFEYANNRAACKAGSFWLWDRRLDDTEIANFLDYQTAHWGIIVGYDVFLVAGQSNAVGVNSGRTDELDGAVSRIYQYKNTDDTLALAADPLDHPSSGGASSNGFALTFAKAYKTSIMAGNRAVILVPQAAGGTSFKDGQWLSTGGDYLTAVAQANEAMALNSANAFKGILWHQGESDYNLPLGDYSTRQEAYAAALDDLISRFRTDIDGADSTTPFVCGNLLDGAELPGSIPISTEVQAAILATPARVTKTAAVASSSLTSDDNLHFDSASQRTLGSRYFTAYQSLI